ncbi:hypothetical protein CB0940_10068 [Cercospora beticola]|uniref:Uncharacterized protein n=1 Tax=Cercospora beticola TaxID=122368 RepID=A0A2G5HTY1_CERBT|nr:hypothetical protein CB0940_10068 [Cercospora beticola]PIA95990.1 hypothetical protein CB0940_10068 [Cercospora beticola]WPB06769.1 hypothetical protein RHO25_011429 [Cercospora beticola]CAK1366675.1 unnamed protein product [Cercospora beticola]
MQLKKPHWLAPTVLVTSFLAGVALAIGHHLYYQSLEGVSPEGRQYNPVTIGTAIVFMVRTTLIITVTTAYWQVFWRVLRRKLPIATIDSLAGALSAVYEILSLKTLRASPLLVGLVLLGWGIRVAIVFPAGTIAPGGNYTIEHHEQVLQYPNFTNAAAYEMSGGERGRDDLAKRDTGMGGGTPYIDGVWRGPTTLLKRIVAPVFYRGVPYLRPPLTNSSYQLTFAGPAVRCENMEVEPILESLSLAMQNCSIDGKPPFCKDDWMSEFRYLSWTPSGILVPFANESISRIDALPVTSNLGARSGGPVSLVVAIRYIADLSSNSNWTVLNCSLYNATYETSFELQNGQQNVTIIGYEISDSVKTNGNSSGLYGVPRDQFAFSKAKTRAYFAVMEMLGEMLTGTVYEARLDSRQIYDTRVLESNLAFTQEMYPIYMNETTRSPVEDPSLPTLASAIEQVVQNITISLFSEPGLLTTESDRTADIVVSRYEIVYFYNWQRLAISYSVVLLLALVAMFVGLYTIFSTGQSYSNNFSTILRVAQNENLAALIEERDRKGQDPLPSHIAKAKFGVEAAGERVELRRRVGKRCKARA